MTHTDVWVCWGTDAPVWDENQPPCRLCGHPNGVHNASRCVSEHGDDAEYIRRWGVKHSDHPSTWWNFHSPLCALCGKSWLHGHGDWRCASQPSDLVLVSPAVAPRLPHAACEDCKHEDGDLCGANKCVCDRCDCWFVHCRYCEHENEYDCTDNECNCGECDCWSHCSECEHASGDCDGACTCCCNDHCGECEHSDPEVCSDNDCGCDCCHAELDTTGATPDEVAMEVLKGDHSWDYAELFGPKDIIPVIAEFYLLSRLTMDNPLAVPVYKAHSKKLSAWLLNQAFCACVGEARWAAQHVNWGGSSLLRLSPLAQALVIHGSEYMGDRGRSEMWLAGYALAQVLGYEKVFDACVEIFGGLSWAEGSFGGKSWEQIAAQCAEFAWGELPEDVFVDRCMDMKHNGGWALDKYYSTRYSCAPRWGEKQLSQIGLSTIKSHFVMQERAQLGYLELNDLLSYKRDQDIRNFYRPERLLPVSPETEELLRDEFAGKDSVRYMRRLLNEPGF